MSSTSARTLGATPALLTRQVTGPKALGGDVEHLLVVVGGADVGLHRDGLAAGVLDELGGFVGGGRVGVVVDDDVEAGGSEVGGDGAADAAGSAGDDGVVVHGVAIVKV